MTALVKCVVWDLDQTLLDGVYTESAVPPPPDPVLAGVLADLGSRGILHAIASKNPPSAAAHAARATGCAFAAAECGWGRKSEAVTRIAASLGLGLDALAFVDDDPYERAEVELALPQVLVLSPEDAADAGGWPEFRPPVVTAEARRRAELYAQRRRRQDSERDFAGPKEDFRRWAGTTISLGYAGPADLPRLHELAVRTHQLNSGEPPGSGAAAPGTEQWFLAALAAPGQDVITVRLRDRFGDDGLVGGCVTAREPAGTVTVRLLVMSCRAMGRGVIDALLAWLVRSAAREGAGQLRVPCVISDRNVPLRLALTAAGFRAPGLRADGGGTAGSTVTFSREVTGPLPALPEGTSAPGEAGPGPA